jgi:hypothetical protein
VLHEGDGDDGTTALATTAESATSTSGADSTTAHELPPEAWLGEYYWVDYDSAFYDQLGQVVTTPVPTRFPRLQLRDDGTCIVEMIHCADPSEPEWSSVFECTLHDDHVRMTNYEGSGIYNAHVLEIEWRFGEQCGQLDEYHRTASGYGRMPVPWLRGRVCVVDPCDPAVVDDPALQAPWTYDLCPDPDCPCEAGCWLPD